MNDFVSLADAAPKTPMQNETPSADFVPFSEAVSRKAAVTAEPLPTWLDTERGKQFYKDVGSGVAHAFADIGDMLLSAPAQVAGVLGDVGARVYEGAKGTPKRLAGQVGRELREDVKEKASPTPFSWLVNTIEQMAGGDPAAMKDPSVVASAFEHIKKRVDTFGEYVDEKTGGRVDKNDVDAAFDAILGRVGLKATKAGLEGGVKWVQEKIAKPGEAGKATPGRPPESPLTPEGEYEAQYDAPAKAVKPSLVEKKARADIEATTGVADVRARDRARSSIVKKAKEEMTEFELQKYLTASAEAQAKWEGKRNQALWRQGGEASPEMLAVLAGGATGALLALNYPDDAEKVLGGGAAFGLAIGGGRPPGAGESLGTILGKGSNTLSTLERLPPNRVEFPKKMIEEQLARADVTKAEKDAFGEVLKRWGDKESITAADLVKGLRVETQNFKLERKDVQKFGGYGLEAIDREDFAYDPMEANVEKPGESAPGDPVRTTIYKVPDHLDLGAANHFNEQNYFGHTRSFDEGGVKHVVEVQSDLAQKAKQRLTTEEFDKLSAEAKDLYKRKEALEKSFARGEAGSDGKNPRREITEIRTRIAEIETKMLAHLKIAPQFSEITPALKNWERRLIREELANSAAKGEEKVRFATADTVAKVEGWPERGTDPLHAANADMDVEAYESAQESERFAPEHQGIYDRYAKDITKFLKGLGAKEVTDDFGHTWLETPTGFKPADPIGSLAAKRVKMFGGAEVGQLKNLAMLSIGAAVGMQLDPENPIIGAFLGGAAGMGVANLKATKEVFGKFVEKDTRTRINTLVDKYDHMLGRAQRQVYQVGEKITSLLPRKADREAVFKAIDEGKAKSLVGPAAEAAKVYTDFTKEVGELAQKAGILDSARQDYATHLWRRADLDKINSWLEKNAPSMAPSSRFAKRRVFERMAQGKAAGFIPMTEDLADVAAIYGNSMSRALANKMLLDRLKNARTSTGDRLFIPADKAPPSFQSINHPVLQGWRIHPDIMPSMKFLFQAQDPGAVMAALSTLSTALKRNAVTLSLFHAKALAEAAIGAIGPTLTAKVFAQSTAPKIFGQQRYLKQVREGGAGDLPDQAIRDGLKISYERGEPSVTDVGEGFYQGVTSLQRWLDEKLPFGIGRSNLKAAAVGAGVGYAISDDKGKGALYGALAGLGVKNYVRINHAFDNWMWGRLHAALKLETYAAKREALMENSAKAGRPLREEQAGRIAATYANDVFGGLNWRQLAEGAKTRWGRDVSLALASPAGRRGLGLLMFAPDWTLSTSRAFLKSFSRGTNLPGIVNAKKQGDLYRQQLLRSAVYYVAVGDALNYSLSGHHIWENDPKVGYFYIDLGDGRKMQLSKHFTEPFHWMPDMRGWKLDFTQTSQQALNKLGTIPKEAAEQALGVNYLSAKGTAPKMDTSAQGRLAHAAKNAVPIGVQQFAESPQAGVLGAAGVPIYGKTKEQERAEAKARRDAEHKRRLDQFKKANGLQ